MGKEITYLSEKLIEKKIQDICIYNPKSKMPASSGKEKGAFRFFKSDTSKEKFFSNDYITDGNTIILNDGGIFNVRYYEGKAGYSDHCIGLHTNEFCNAKYLYYHLLSKADYINYYGFVGGTLKNIDKNWLNELLLKIPSDIRIQKKIADLHFEIDYLLEQKNSELNKMRNIKQSMLYKMFPTRGSNIPKIRFAEFTEIWEETTLENNCRFYKGKGYSKKDVTNSGTQLFLYGRLYTNYSNEVVEIDTFTKYTDPAAYVSTGNEIVIPSSGETAEDISRATAILSEGIILGGDLNILVPSDNFYTPFLSLLITHSNFHIELSKKAQGKTVVHVHNDDIKDITFLYPKKEEQKRIVEFFRNLDKSIAYQEKEIVTLERLKDTLLKKMFA